MKRDGTIELVQRARSGDREAFGELVERYGDMVFGLCYGMSGNRADAEDLAHDAFVEAFLKIGQLEECARFGGWLRMLALNLCRMWYRRRRIERDGLGEDEMVDGTGEVEYVSVIRGLSELNEGQRMVLLLHYWEGMSYEEVADFLEVPVGTVMSRMHRSRRALKRIADELKEKEEWIMVPDEEFGRAIDAEIEVLLKLCREKPESTERLEQILEHAPERFVELIAGMGEELVAPLVLMVKRLGRSAVAAALDCYFEAEEAQTRAHAQTLLRALLATAGKRPPGEEGREGNLPQAREAYFLLDRLIVAGWDEGEKVELIVELLEACHHSQRKLFPDESEETLLVNALLCYEDVAFPLLVERFWNAADRRELAGQEWMLYALKRSGPRFGRVLLEGLAGDDRRKLDLALCGLEILLPWPDGKWIDEMPAMQRQMELRFYGKFAPNALRQMERDAALRGDLGKALVALSKRDEAEVRDQAIASIGGLGAPEFFGEIRALAGHEEVSTRLAVLRALSNAGDQEAVEIFMNAARKGEAAERRIAAEGLGRLRKEEALPLLVEMAEGGNGAVSEAAAIALGEIGGAVARGSLERLIKSGDRRLAKAAGSALYGNRKKNVFWADEERERSSEKRWALNRRRLEKVRGDAEPFFYHNVTAALAALPEVRSYSEPDLTHHIAQVEIDYAHTRRHLVVRRIMKRVDREYAFTGLGEAMWRVERFIAESYGPRCW